MKIFAAVKACRDADQRADCSELNLLLNWWLLPSPSRFIDKPQNTWVLQVCITVEAAPLQYGFPLL